MAEDIPQRVIEVLAEVSDTGAVDMSNRKTLVGIARLLGEHDAANWLRDNPRRYKAALKAAKLHPKGGA